ncbi:hypothetical protein K435DRAFT_897880 [Dendrothele bispora CBS 962.96]|uniref:F-box domain-containing protein n=1 Tax=Dendrothele bispora (strain CBS 962.96) TaxID=1314807 RepID=A0A4S8KME5_DENBC|nr:hypothetical protein K435DRAFT_897880 [Dendrothele bispora CBS 962.96]
MANFILNTIRNTFFRFVFGDRMFVFGSDKNPPTAAQGEQPVSPFSTFPEDERAVLALASLREDESETQINVFEPTIFSSETQIHVFESTRSPSAAQSLPSDVLFVIFDVCLSSSFIQTDSDLSEAEGQPYWLVKNPPWVFTHVCTHWRRAAISRRSLWTHVRINVSEFQGFDTPGQARLLEVYLARSGELELEVYINLMIPFVQNNVVLPILLRHSSRFGSFSLTTFSESLPYFASIQERLDSLKSLYLDVICQSSSQISRSPIQFFSIAPLLEVVTIQPSDNRQKFPFTTHRLRKLSAPMSAISNFELLTTIGECILHVDQVGHQFFNKVMTSFTLQSLTLYEHSPVMTGRASLLLTSLLLPNLVSLAIQASDNPSIGSSIKTLLLNSKCKLRNLDIEARGFSSNDAGEILQLCPDLVRLRLTTPFSPFTVQQLQKNTLFLPKLETFDMTATEFKSVLYLPADLLSVCDAFRGRCFAGNTSTQTKGPVPLKEFYFASQFDVSQDVSEGLAEMVKSGVKVYVEGRLLGLEDLNVDGLAVAITEHEGKVGDTVTTYTGKSE